MGTSLLTRLEAEVRRWGGHTNDLCRPFTTADLPLVEKFARQVVNYDLPKDNIFSVDFLYHLPLEYLIEAGNFTKINKYLDLSTCSRECELIKRPGGKIELINFGQFVEPAEVYARFKRKHLRPSTNHELSSFALAHPGIQRKYPIAGFGTIWLDPKGIERVPCLYGDAVDRVFDLRPIDCMWCGYWHFAGTHET